MFSSAFHEIFKRVYSQINHNSEIEFALSLYYSVKAWCDTLEFDSETKEYILRNTENSENQELPKYIWEETQGTTYYINRINLKDIIRKIAEKLLYRRVDKTKIILIIAFGFTSVSYLLYLIDKNKQSQINENFPKTPDISSHKVERLPSSPPPDQEKTNQILILVVNVSNSEIIARLQKKGKVDTDDCKKLYRVTEALWLGSKADLSPKLAQSFSESNQFLVSSNEESEYNIYLIKIELNEANEGFQANAGQLDRIDAFSRLEQLSTKVEVSPRLKVEVYENTGVYSR